MPRRPRITLESSFCCVSLLVAMQHNAVHAYQASVSPAQPLINRSFTTILSNLTTLCKTRTELLQEPTSITNISGPKIPSSSFLIPNTSFLT